MASLLQSPVLDHAHFKAFYDQRRRDLAERKEPFKSEGRMPDAFPDIIKCANNKYSTEICLIDEDIVRMRRRRKELCINM